MSLNIKNEETHRLAKELARLIVRQWQAQSLLPCESVLIAKDESAVSRSGCSGYVWSANAAPVC